MLLRTVWKAICRYSPECTANAVHQQVLQVATSGGDLLMVTAACTACDLDPVSSRYVKERQRLVPMLLSSKTSSQRGSQLPWHGPTGGVCPLPIWGSWCPPPLGKRCVSALYAPIWSRSIHFSPEVAKRAPARSRSLEDVSGVLRYTCSARGILSCLITATHLGPLELLKERQL